MKMIRFDGPAMHRCNSLGNSVTYGAAPAKRNTGKVYLFDGTMFGMLATPWSPTGSSFQISCRMRMTGVFTGRWAVSNQVTNTTIGVGSAGAVVGRFTKDTTVPLTTPVSPAIDTTYDLLLNCAPGNNYAEALLQKSPIDTGTALAASNSIERIGGNNATLGIIGYMDRVRLTDIDDPTNSVFYPMDEGAGNYFYAYDADGVGKKPEFDAFIANFDPKNWITYLIPAQQPVLP